MLFTPELFSSFQSNLHINVGSRNHGTIQLDDNYEDYWFQLLIFEKEKDSPESENFKPKLVYGTKKNLRKHYKFPDEDNNKKVDLDDKTVLVLPTDGVKVDLDFVSNTAPEYPTVRFLLQCRRLSQMA